MDKKKKIIVIISIVLIITLTALVCIFLSGKKSSLSTYVSNSEVINTTGYTMNLQIKGNYNNNEFNKYVLVTNYKNTDKTIAYKNIDSDKEEQNEYVKKSSKFYQVKNNEWIEINKIPYENTDQFLYGIKNIKKIKKSNEYSVGNEIYTIYSGIISKEELNKIIKYTDLDININKNATVEVWITSDNHIYKIYYRIDNLEIYASFYGYGKTNSVSLNDYYK